MRYKLIRLLVGVLTLTQLAFFIAKFAGFDLAWWCVLLPLWLPCLALTAGVILWLVLDGCWDAFAHYWKKR